MIEKSVFIARTARAYDSRNVRIGIHTSIAGSLERSALKAAELGANTFQIFSSSPRQWKASVPSASSIRLLQRARDRHDLTPLVIHDNYLINLASAHEGIRAQSIQAFRGELERAIAIGAEYLVAHPGNYKGQTIEQGILHVIEGVAAAAAGLNFGKLMLLIENTAGVGAQLGRDVAADLGAAFNRWHESCGLPGRKSGEERKER